MSQNLNTWDVFWTSECSRKVASGRRVAGAIRSLVNARSLQLECDRVWSYMSHFWCLFLRIVVDNDMEGEGKV